LDDVLLEFRRLVNEVIRDVELVADGAGVGDGLRAAAFVLGAVHAILRPELERDADDLVALLQQKRRRGGGVHSSAHAADDALALLRIHRRTLYNARAACKMVCEVNDGKVIWTYSTGKGWEYDDAWLLSNGNILFSRMAYAAEVTPQKKVVWRLDPPKGTEIHTVQPIGLDKVLLVENGTPPRMLIINIKTGAVVTEHVIPNAGAGVHGQFRRFRITASGTYLAPYLQMGKVVEYDKNFNPIWSYKIPSPWAAIRLKNGNTLITDEKDELTRIQNAKAQTWKKQSGSLGHRAGLHGNEFFLRAAQGQAGDDRPASGGRGTRRHVLRHRRSLRPVHQRELVGEALAPFRKQW
jgi:hypothetical protein